METRYGGIGEIGVIIMYVVNTLIVVLIVLTGPLAMLGQSNLVRAPEDDKTSTNFTPEKFKFLVSEDLPRFVEEVNKLGKINYRVVKTFNFGGDAARAQSFAAVLELDTENTYEYDWLTSPNKNYLESRLNFRTEKGFYPVATFAVTACGDASYDPDGEPALTNSPLLRQTMGDIFFLERKNGNTTKTRDYKVFIGKIGLGKSPSKELQTALDNAASDYRPFKILFSRNGLVDFSVSILLEHDLSKSGRSKVNYRFVKQASGFEKEVNGLAQEGYRFWAGRRVGLVKFAILAKTAETPISYVFVDQVKYEKEIPKTIKAGDVYAAELVGTSECDSVKTIGGKLVFEQNPNGISKDVDHKYLRLSGNKSSALQSEKLEEAAKFLSVGYAVKGVFFSEGVVLVLAKD